MVREEVTYRSQPRADRLRLQEVAGIAHFQGLVFVQLLEFCDSLRQRVVEQLDIRHRRSLVWTFSHTLL